MDESHCNQVLPTILEDHRFSDRRIAYSTQASNHTLDMVFDGAFELAIK
jgi:hypothetical protein